MLVWLDGFDDFAPLAAKYPAGSIGLAAYGLTGGAVNNLGYLNLSANSLMMVRTPTFTGDSTVIVGFHGQYRGSGTNAQDWIQFYEGSTIHVQARLNADMSIGFYRNGTLLGTSPIVLALNTWLFIEIKVVISDTTGSIEVRKNGAVVYTLTGLDTRNAGTGVIDNVAFISTNNWGPSYYVDNWYVVTGTGGINTGYLGEIIVDTLEPNQQGFYAQGVGSDGNSIDNYTLVNETTPDTTTYVDLQAAGNADSYNVDTPFSSVVGVMIQTYAEKSDVGARTLQQIVRIGGTDYNAGSAYALTAAAWAIQPTVLDANPATNLAWTVTAFNAAEFGAKAA